MPAAVRSGSAKRAFAGRLPAGFARSIHPRGGSHPGSRPARREGGRCSDKGVSQGLCALGEEGRSFCLAPRLSLGPPPLQVPPFFCSAGRARSTSDRHAMAVSPCVCSPARGLSRSEGRGRARGRAAAWRVEPSTPPRPWAGAGPSRPRGPSPYPRGVGLGLWDRWGGEGERVGVRGPLRPPWGSPRSLLPAPPPPCPQQPFKIRAGLALLMSTPETLALDVDC